LLAGQQHTFEVRAVDTQGNVDPTPASFTWTILTPTQAIQKLINTINSFHLPRGWQPFASLFKESEGRIKISSLTNQVFDLSTSNRPSCN
jgi:hypothetical protein